MRFILNRLTYLLSQVRKQKRAELGDKITVNV